VPDDARVVRLLQRAGQAVGTELRTATIGGGSDANVFNNRGIESVVFGTGMRDIHTVNEWLDLNDFYSCADVVLQSIALNAAP